MKLKIFLIFLLNIYLTKNANEIVFSGNKIVDAIRNIKQSQALTDQTALANQITAVLEYANKEKIIASIEKGSCSSYISKEYIIFNKDSKDYYEIYQSYFEILLEKQKNNKRLCENFLSQEQPANTSYKHGLLGNLVSPSLLDNLCKTSKSFSKGISEINKTGRDAVATADKAVEQSNATVITIFASIMKEIKTKELLIDSIVIAVAIVLSYMSMKKLNFGLSLSVIVSIIVTTIIFIKNDHSIVLHIKAFMQALCEWVECQKKNENSRIATLYKFIFSWQMLINTAAFLVAYWLYSSKINSSIYNPICKMLSELKNNLNQLANKLNQKDLYPYPAIEQSIVSLQKKLDDYGKKNLPAYIDLLQTIFKKIDSHNTKNELENALNNINCYKNFFPSCMEFTKITKSLSELALVKKEINFDDINSSIQKLQYSTREWENITIMLLNYLCTASTFFLHIDKKGYNWIVNPSMIKLFLICGTIIFQRLYNKPIPFFGYLKTYWRILIMFFGIDIIYYITKDVFDKKNASMIEAEEDPARESFRQLFSRYKKIESNELKEKDKQSDPTEQIKELNFCLLFEHSKGTEIKISWNTEIDYLYHARLVELLIQESLLIKSLKKNGIHDIANQEEYKLKLNKIKNQIEEENTSVKKAIEKIKDFLEDPEKNYLFALEYFLCHNTNKFHDHKKFSKTIKKINYFHQYYDDHDEEMKPYTQALLTGYNSYHNIQTTEKKAPKAPNKSSLNQCMRLMNKSDFRNESRQATAEYLSDAGAEDFSDKDIEEINSNSKIIYQLKRESSALGENDDEEEFFSCNDQEDFVKDGAKQKIQLINKIKNLNNNIWNGILTNIKKNNFEDAQLTFLLALDDTLLGKILENAKKTITIETKKINEQEVYKILNRDLLNDEFEAFAKLFLTNLDDIDKKCKKYIKKMKKKIALLSKEDKPLLENSSSCEIM